MWSRGRGARPTAFTVVELMIVVLLIGLLIAIAVPAFRQAQVRAQRLACRNNLRQIYGALSNYATAYQGLLPTNEPGGEERYPWPPGRQMTASLTVQEDVSRNWIGTRVEPWGLGKLHQQLGGDLRVLFCPGDGDRDVAAYRKAFLDNRFLDTGDTPDCSYLYRGRDAPDVSTFDPGNGSPGKAGAIARFGDGSDSVRALAMDCYLDKFDSPRFHGDRICVLFEDGSTLDVALSVGRDQDRFITSTDPNPSVRQARLDEIWRRADQLYESDD